LVVTEGTAETIALAEALGLDPNLVIEAVNGGGLDLPYFRMKAKLMFDGEFPPSFSLALAAKDARLDPGVLPPERVLEMATLHGARALDLEAEIGSIEAGKRADLVLLDAPNVLHLAYHYGIDPVAAVVKGGRVAYRA
jgi:imidazolonepropionase-like amidohydrolase